MFYNKVENNIQERENFCSAVNYGIQNLGPRRVKCKDKEIIRRGLSNRYAIGEGSHHIVAPSVNKKDAFCSTR